MGVAVVRGSGMVIKARGETQICGIQAHGNLIKNPVREKKKQSSLFLSVSRSECKAREPANMHLAELEI